MRDLTGFEELGAGLPENRPGCGSLTEAPGAEYELRARYDNTGLVARRISLPPTADLVEACYDRGWTDGMPGNAADHRAGVEDARWHAAPGRRNDRRYPPNFMSCTIEKVAINAVMAGCRPEYMPLVLTVIEAALIPEFNLHGLLATTNTVAPVVMVNGPLAGALGMNGKVNVFGQGNRAARRHRPDPAIGGCAMSAAESRARSTGRCSAIRANIVSALPRMKPIRVGIPMPSNRDIRPTNPPSPCLAAMGLRRSSIISPDAGRTLPKLYQQPARHL